MPRTDLFLKVSIEHDEDDRPESLAEEICRVILRVYGVQAAELSSFVAHPE